MEGRLHVEEGVLRIRKRSSTKSMRNYLHIGVYVALLLMLMSCGGADVAMKKGDRYFEIGEN